MRQSIESAANRRLRITRSLGSRSGVLKQGLFLMEGPKFISDYMTVSRPEWLVVSEGAGSAAAALAQRAAESGTAVLDVPRKLFEELSDTVHSQGVIAVCLLPEAVLPEIKPAATVLALDGLSDPGNMGTLIRSAAAFGCTAVVAGKGSCCPFIPKVTRAASGLNASIPVLFDTDLADWLNDLPGGTVVMGAEAGCTPFDARHDTDPMVLVIGSEAHGISVEVRNRLTGTVSIPMAPVVESLNAAVSGSILLYLLTRS